MPTRLIATDLDGTLLRSDMTVSERTRRALVAAADAGVRVVMATARPPRTIRPIVDQLGEGGYAGVVVCANGALVYDPASHQLIERREIHPESAIEMVRRLRAEMPDVLLGLEQGMVARIEPAYEPFAWPGDTYEVVDLDVWLEQPVTKLLLRWPGSAPDGHGSRVRGLIGDLADVTVSTDESFLEVMAPGVHKAATVEALIGAEGIDATDVIAFGDMPNDIELLQWAGWGVAVANAHPAVIDIADEVTESNDADGVAVVIERLLSD